MPLHVRSTFLNSVHDQVGDESITRPWSKYSEGSSAHERVVQKHKPLDAAEKGKKEKKPLILTEEQALLRKIKTDPEIKAFVDAMKPRSKGKVWENEGDGLNMAAVSVKQEAVMSKKTGGDGMLLTRTHMKFESDTSSDEEYDEAPESTNKVSLFFGVCKKNRYDAVVFFWCIV